MTTQTAFRDPTERTAERVSTPVPDSVDVAIVGAGPSSLTAAAYLARQGRSVAVFDPHYVAGGSATQFARGRAGNRYRFDVGLHYIGEVEPDQPLGRMFTELGLDLEFSPLDPDGYDVFHFPDFSFRMPADLDLYRDRMVELFPHERKGIDRYMSYVRQVDFARRLVADQDGRMPPLVNLQILFRAWRVVRHLKHTLTQAYDAMGIRDPKLRALIAAQQGIYGLPPGEVSAMLNAVMAGHFATGAWYPVGGGQAISDALADTIEEHGGAICLRQRVERIRVEDGRAVGVDVVSHRGVKHTVAAKSVISGADIKRTVGELVDPGDLPDAWRDKVLGMHMGAALFLTCLGVEGSRDELHALGLGAYNAWQFDGYDFDGYFAEGRETGPLPLHGAYVTSGTLKDGHAEPGSHAPPGHATLEVMSMVHGDPASWGVEVAGVDKRKYRHTEAYQELKEEAERQLIERTEQMFPGLKERIVFQESATPITTLRYTGADWGVSYGVAATVGQSHTARPDERSPIDGLYLCGASCRSYHGIYGVMSSGRAAARRLIEETGGRMGGPAARLIPAAPRT